MPYGTVCLFNDIIGSGYIDPDDGSSRISVSYRAIRRDGYKILHEGQRVKYDITEIYNIKHAINVEFSPDSE